MSFENKCIDLEFCEASERSMNSIAETVVQDFQ